MISAEVFSCIGLFLTFFLPSVFLSGWIHHLGTLLCLNLYHTVLERLIPKVCFPPQTPPQVREMFTLVVYLLCVCVCV